jgi:hypothetical protein
MSALGPKQTSAIALHMSAIGGKADMTIAEIRFRIAVPTSASDPGIGSESTSASDAKRKK